MERSRSIKFLNLTQGKRSSKNAGCFKTGKSSGSPGNSELPDYKIYSLSVRERIFYGLFAAGASAVIAYTFFRSMAFFMVLAAISAAFYPEYRKKSLKEKRKNKLNIQFKEAIEILSSFISAGYSVENAFYNTAGELINLFGKDAMIVKEFIHISDSVNMNKPVEKLLYEFSERSGLDDIRNFSEVFSVAKRNGGELRGIIEHTTEIIRERITVAEEINNLTASQRYQQRIMNMLPFAIILYIDFTSKGFFDALYQTFLGKAVMSICLILYAVSFVMSEKILDIKI